MYHGSCFVQEKLQLGPGQLMREIGESMTQRTVCDGVPSLYLYSGHDATIMSVAGENDG